MADDMQISAAQPQETPTRRRWGTMVFALVLAGVMVFYAWSVMDIARNLTDYLLILPAAVIGVAAALWAGLADLRPAKGLATLTRRSLREEMKPIALLALTMLYACSAPFLGFDIATALFIALALLLQGERSWWKIAVAALPGAALITWVFVELLAVRMPVTLF